jgi:chromosomal replication initiator protein
MAAYLSKEWTEASLAEIGFKLGKRTHATVLHSIALIKEQLEYDPLIRQQVAQLETALRH